MIKVIILAGSEFWCGGWKFPGLPE